MRRLFSVSALVAILAVGLLTSQAALTQTTTGVQPQSQDIIVRIANDCNSTLIAQSFNFSDGRSSQIKLILPGIQVAAGSTEDIPFDDINLDPTTVVVAGVLGNQNFSATAAVNDPANVGQCANIFLFVGGQTSEIPGTSGQAQLPSDFQGFESLSAEQAIVQLQSKGYTVDVQGSAASPKLGDVSDPLLLGALPSGLQARAIFVSAPGQLRAAATYDQSNANVILMVFGGGFCASLSPTFVGVPGLSVNCDRPAAMAPFTTIGGGPVAGFVHLVLLIKLGGPTLPYVLSLSS